MTWHIFTSLFWYQAFICLKPLPWERQGSACNDGDKVSRMNLSPPPPPEVGLFCEPDKCFWVKLKDFYHFYTAPHSTQICRWSYQYPGPYCHGKLCPVVPWFSVPHCHGKTVWPVVPWFSVPHCHGKTVWPVVPWFSVPYWLWKLCGLWSPGFLYLTDNGRCVACGLLVLCTLLTLEAVWTVVP